MRANRRRDTGPERAVRSLLHARGLRYRVDLPIRVGALRPVRPDLVFTRARVCCFIDGCWWHGCPEHGRRRTSANDEYWSAKIARNVERDAEHRSVLEAAGWTVLRFWEHEDPADVADRIADAVAARPPHSRPAAPELQLASRERRALGATTAGSSGRATRQS